MSTSRPCAFCSKDFIPPEPRRICCSRTCAGRYSHRNDVLIPPEQRFWGHVDKTGRCWLWTGAKNNKGYGIFGVTSKRLILAHRYSWALANGPIEGGGDVLHNCPDGDNPLCVNPRHLFLGSHADNMADAANKGRMAHGEKHYNSKLSDEQVHNLRHLVLSEGMRQKDASIMFGIHQSTVSQIVNNLRRKKSK